MINESFYDYTSKFILKRYIQQIYKVVLQLQALFHTIQIVYYHFFIRNYIRHHRNAALRLQYHGQLKHHTMLLNYSNKRSL